MTRLTRTLMLAALSGAVLLTSTGCVGDALGRVFFFLGPFLL